MPPLRRPLSGYPLSDAALRKKVQDNELSRFLRFYARHSRTFDFFDFTENAAIGDYPFAVANSGGTAAASFAIPSTKVRNGVITATTGTDDNASLSLIGQLIHRGADNAGVECRLQIDAVTGYNLEVGLIDAVPGSNASGVSDVDTPAAAFTNGAVFTIDTDQTLTTLAAVSKGNAASQAIAATTLSAPTNLTAATYHTFGVELVQSGSSSSVAGVRFYIDGKQVANHAPAAGAVNGATLLGFWIYLRTRNTTAKVPTVDYIAQWSDRAA